MCFQLLKYRGTENSWSVYWNAAADPSEDTPWPWPAQRSTYVGKHGESREAEYREAQTTSGLCSCGRSCSQSASASYSADKCIVIVSHGCQQQRQR